MPRSSSNDDPRVQVAVKKKCDLINISIPDAMKLADFTSEEIKDMALQQRIRRLALKRTGQKQPTQITIDSSTMSTVSTITATPPSVKGKQKKVRHTSAAAQQRRKNILVDKKAKSTAMKYATKLYAESQKPGVKTLSGKQVAAITRQKLGIKVSSRSITDNVKKGRVGTSPLKTGPKGNFDDDTIRNLNDAFETYVKIKQLNGQSGNVTRKKLQELLVKCTTPKLACNCEWLLKRLIKESGVDFNVGKNNNAEQRRIMWTTYYNLKIWFDNWERNLLELGFAKKEDGKTVIPKEQLARILNIDETCLVMDGSSSQRGGRPAVIFTTNSLPNLGNATIKNSVSSTMITGSTPYGESLPPHFQFGTAAKSTELMKIRAEVDRFLVKVKGKFGFEEERELPCTVAMNEKGGMDEKEFRLYCLNSIVPLYPDAEDLPGKRVMIKVDSGPGRLNKDLLAELRLLGFYLYPGVPNTTAVTQETDQSYGPFKTQFVTNLNELSQVRIEEGLTSLPPHVVPLFVFGGIDPDTDHELKTSAFEVGFAEEQNKAVWVKCGAAPLTRTPLHNHRQVKRELGDDDDDFNAMMRQIQSTNDLSTLFLTTAGFDGSAFKVQIQKKKEPKKMTVRHSQERIDAIAKATTHGQHFHVTGGDHLTSDDIFIATEKKEREREILVLKKKKAEFEKMNSVAAKAKELLQRGGKFKLDELKVILKYHQVSKWSSYKFPDADAKVKEIISRGKPAPAYENWTDAEEQRLVDLMTKPIYIGDTALGRKRQLEKMKLNAAINTMTKAEREEVFKKLKVADEREVTEVPVPAVAIRPNLGGQSTEPTQAAESVPPVPEEEPKEENPSFDVVAM